MYLVVPPSILDDSFAYVLQKHSLKYLSFDNCLLDRQKRVLLPNGYPSCAFCTYHNLQTPSDKSGSEILYQQMAWYFHQKISEASNFVFSALCLWLAILKWKVDMEVSKIFWKTNADKQI